jgi:hypothetical protein
VQVLFVSDIVRGGGVYKWCYLQEGCICSDVRSFPYGILGTMPGVERSWAFSVLRRAVPNLSLRSARALVTMLRRVFSSYCGCPPEPTGNTVHSTYGVNAFRRTFSSLDSCSAALSCSTVHFIDEYSMLHALHFAVVLQRIRTAQACDSINTMLHENLIIFLGDEAQLPCVCNSTKCTRVAGVCTRHHIATSAFFARAFHD